MCNFIKEDGIYLMGDYSILILYLLFMEIDVSYDGKIIILEMDIYFYKVYFEKLLFYKFRIFRI